MERDAFIDLIRVIQQEMDESCGAGAVIVCDEQAFLKVSADDIRNKLICVVKYSPASTNYGQTSLPFALYVLGYANRTEEAKGVLTEFVLSNNLRDNIEVAGNYCLQLYNTPSSAQNFLEVADGFNSLFVISAYAVFGEASNGISSITYNEAERLKLISASFSFDISNNTQPIVSADGLAISVGQFGTMALSITAYMISGSSLITTILDILSNPTMGKMDTKYPLKITLRNGETINREWRLSSFSVSQSLGALPMVSMAFIA